MRLTLPWSRPRIQDAHFRERYEKLPRILARWIGRRAFRGASVLDFGCGEAVTALAVARSLGPRRVVGVDVMPDPQRCLPLARQHLGLEALPAELELHQVTPGRLHDPTERFDIIYTWSVFEHVDRSLLDATVGLLREALKPGGVLFIQVAPLFFSARGSHLGHVLPEPWLHLTLPEDALRERLAAATSAAQCEALWSTYRGLNRITALELIELLQRHGFDICRTHATRSREVPDADLVARWPGDALTTEQIVVMARVA